MQRELVRTEAGTWRRLTKRRMALVALVVLFLLGGTAVLATALLATPGPVPGIPSLLAGLPLGHRLDGADAAREIDRLHGKTIRVRAATAAHYERPGSVAMLYVSDAYLGFLAERQLQAMTDGMKKGESPFAPPREFQQAGQKVFWNPPRTQEYTARCGKSAAGPGPRPLTGIALLLAHRQAPAAAVAADRRPGRLALLGDPLAHRSSPPSGQDFLLGGRLTRAVAGRLAVFWAGPSRHEQPALLRGGA